MAYNKYEYWVKTKNGVIVTPEQWRLGDLIYEGFRTKDDCSNDYKVEDDSWEYEGSDKCLTHDTRYVITEETICYRGVEYFLEQLQYLDGDVWVNYEPNILKRGDVKNLDGNKECEKTTR